MFKLVPKSRLELILWIVLLLIISGLLLVVDYVVNYWVSWGLYASLGVFILTLVVIGIYLSGNYVGIGKVILWIVLLMIICGVFFGVDYIDASSVREWRESPSHKKLEEFTVEDFFAPREGTFHVITPFTWAPWASIGIVIFGVYVMGIYSIHSHATHNGRNVVRWITASMVFSPLLAGLVYLLTWPEKRRGGT